jgi:PQQ-dependent dehydrogenase (methanol/ethanol family)
MRFAVFAATLAVLASSPLQATDRSGETDWRRGDGRQHGHHFGHFKGRAQPEPHQPDACCTAAGKDHPYVYGNLGNQNYSRLRDITPHNVKRLGGAWLLRLDGGVVTGDQQSTPVVVDGVMYVQSASQKVFAIDAKTGQVKWQYAAGGSNFNLRGVAVADGKVFSSLQGRRVVALDKETGALLWQTTLGCAPAGPTCEFPGGSTPTAVVYHEGLIYVGTGGGDGSYRGRGYALNANDGSIAWVFWGPAAPGTIGGDTWEGESWRNGGAAPWIHPAVDPDLDLVYWTFGNPFPVTNGANRGGDNLFSASIVAIEAKTGKHRWHFQTSRHDLWDYDNTMAPVLMDIRVHGKKRKAVVVAGKTGYLYILDRVTGEPIVGIDDKPVPQDARQKTAATQPIPRGDHYVPICPDPDSRRLSARPVPHYEYGCVFTPHWDRPVIAAPGTGGGADWSALSFNPDTGLLYFGAGLVNSAFTNGLPGSAARFTRPLGEYRSGKILAMDPRTNRIAWQKHTVWSLAHGNGVLTTRGGVMFIGQPDGYLVAMDVDNGRELWRFQTGAGVHTSPVTYEVDGTQYVAVLAGGNGLPYDSPNGDFLWAFKLGGTVPAVEAPEPPPIRQPINAAAVTGAVASFTVTLGRTWVTSTNTPSATENSVSANAVAPQHLSIPVGSTVTFVNPAGNVQSHCASSFFGAEFDSGVLTPGQQFVHTFAKPGEYFYNNCVFPQITGKIVVQ